MSISPPFHFSQATVLSKRLSAYHQTNGFLSPTSPHFKPQLDRFGRFGRAHTRQQQTNKDRPTGQLTDHATPCAAVGRILVLCLRCGLIIQFVSSRTKMRRYTASRRHLLLPLTMLTMMWFNSCQVASASQKQAVGNEQLPTTQTGASS